MFLKYFQRKKKEKLYQQWVERAGLPSEEVPSSNGEPENVPQLRHKPEVTGPAANNFPIIHPTSKSQVATHSEVSGDIWVGEDKKRKHLRLLYYLLGISVLILCVGLILLLLSLR